MDTTMDAITKKKTLTSVFTMLLLGSAFVGMLTAVTPIASAQAPTATVDHSVVWDGGGWNTDPTPDIVGSSCCDTPTPDLAFNHTYNLKVAFVDSCGGCGTVSASTTTDTYKLCRTTALNLSTECES